MAEQQQPADASAGLTVESLRRKVDLAVEMTAEARQQSERANDYYHGDQWTPEETAILQKRKQPVVTINRIQRKVDAVMAEDIDRRRRQQPTRCGDDRPVPLEDMDMQVG